MAALPFSAVSQIGSHTQIVGHVDIGSGADQQLDSLEIAPITCPMKSP